MKTSRFLLLTGMALAMMFTFSCSPDDPQENNGSSSPSGGGNSSPSNGLSSSSFCVNPSSYDSFRTVTIGSQTWMAENLNYNACGSRCYDNNPANCTKYGRLYDWATAMDLPESCNINVCSGQIQSIKGICPSGWHIPSNSDWEILLDYVRTDNNVEYSLGYNIAGKYLKATSGWNSNGNGEDKYGFAAIPSGYSYKDYGSSSIYFSEAGNYGYWWTSSEFDWMNAKYSLMHYGTENVSLSYDAKFYLHSVRCIQD